MKLSKSQIDQLFNFTRQHYVEWYDLQSELVDHLANAIETEWEQNPKLTFDEVLNNEFRKFGVFGFMDVVEERQKFLGKKYNHLIWKYYKDFFRLPKIILTLGSMFMLYKLMFVFGELKEIIITTVVVLSIGLFIYTFFKTRRLKNSQDINRKKWLFEEVSIQRRNAIIMILPSFIINVTHNFFQGDDWTNLTKIIYPIALVLIALYIFIQLKIIPKRVAEDLAKTYPEYSLQKV
jgi:hypothetical protein